MALGISIGIKLIGVIKIVIERRMALGMNRILV
jgi:hypothetical protein